MHARTLGVGVAVGVIASFSLAGVASAARVEAPPRTPIVTDAAERQVALGVSVWDGRRLSELDAFIRSMRGRRPATWTIWSQWGDPDTRSFPTSQAWGVRARGVTPMIWWEPVDPADLGSPRYARLANIAAGRHDDYIRRFARGARTFGTPIILRFAHEPNGGTFPWGVRGFDNSPATFVAAWRRVHRLFEEEGATNVRFLWSVGKQACPGGCDPYSRFYPGDAYVDYLGFSSFNWGAKRDGWVPMIKGFQRVTKTLSRIFGQADHRGGERQQRAGRGQGRLDQRRLSEGVRGTAPDRRDRLSRRGPPIDGPPGLAPGECAREPSRRTPTWPRWRNSRVACWVERAASPEHADALC